MKKNNKGFSLVELIIVIAIMAILAGAIAPALIRYIDKSRRSNDVSAAKTIDTAMSAALGNEKVYELLVTNAAVIQIKPNTTCSSTSSAAFTLAYPSGATWDDGFDKTGAVAILKEELGKSLSNKTPKISYKKAAKGSAKPAFYYVAIDKNGKVSVLIGAASKSETLISDATSAAGVPVKDVEGLYSLVPECCDSYQ